MTSATSPRLLRRLPKRATHSAQRCCKATPSRWLLLRFATRKLYHVPPGHRSDHEVELGRAACRTRLTERSGWHQLALELGGGSPVVAARVRADDEPVGGRRPGAAVRPEEDGPAESAAPFVVGLFPPPPDPLENIAKHSPRTVRHFNPVMTIPFTK